LDKSEPSAVLSREDAIANGETQEEEALTAPRGVWDSVSDSVGGLFRLPRLDRRGAAALIGLALASWLATTLYRVQPDEKGVVLRLGRWVATTEPGLHFHMPYPIETVLLPKVTQVNQVLLGVGPPGGPNEAQTNRGRQMLTGDENIVEADCTVFWRIRDPGQFLFKIDNPELAVRITAEGALRDVIIPTAVPRLFIAPSTMDLLGVELEISGHDDRSYKLRNALRTYGKSSGDDPQSVTYVVVDCPPSLNLLTINALAAADAVVVPLQCEFFALEGLSQLLTTVEQVRRTLNPALTIHGVVLTMYDPRNSLAGQVVADVRAYMGDKVYETVIPRNVRLSEAPSHGKPALLYDLKCAGSQAYLKLASEVIQREGRWRAA